MIYIILPAYNEADNIDLLLEKIETIMKKISLDFLTIVINDGSTDNTRDIVSSYASNMPIRLIEHKGNKGLGVSIKSGLTEIAKRLSHGDIVITMDADNSHEPVLMQKMLERIGEGYDLVVASRYQKGAQEIGVSFKRRLLSKVANLLLSRVFPVEGLKDFTSSYRAYRASKLKEAMFFYDDTLIEEANFSSTAEIIIKLRRFSPKVKEIPFILRYDQKKGRSKMNIPLEIFNYSVLIFKRLLLKETI